MAQGIHSGGGGDLPGQLLDHYRIQYHIVGNHLAVDDAHLQLLLRHGHDGVWGGLGAGAGGGGDHQGLDVLPAERRCVQQVLHGIFPGGQDAGQLGGIHDAAAAHGYDKVSAAGRVGVRQGLDLGVGGLRGQVVKDHALYPGGPDPVHGEVQQAGALDALIRKDGGFFYPVGQQDGLQVF